MLLFFQNPTIQSSLRLFMFVHHTRLAAASSVIVGEHYERYAVVTQNLIHSPLDKYEQMFHPISCEQMRDVQTPRWGVSSNCGVRKPCLRHAAAWLPQSRGVMLLLVAIGLGRLARTLSDS
jgi:hypothetical protein